MKRTLIGLTLGLSLLLTGCSYHSGPAIESQYNGKAVVTGSGGSGTKRGCEVYFTLSKTGQKDTQHLGRRSSCDGWTAGRIITLTNGLINR
jgi:hypothetical protein